MHTQRSSFVLLPGDTLTSSFSSSKYVSCRLHKPKDLFTCRRTKKKKTACDITNQPHRTRGTGSHFYINVLALGCGRLYSNRSFTGPFH